MNNVGRFQFSLASLFAGTTGIAGGLALAFYTIPLLQKMSFLPVATIAIGALMIVSGLAILLFLLRRGRQIQ